MISPASFNYYQEVEREARDIPEPELRKTHEPVEAHRVLQEHMLVPWGILACDVE